MNEEFEKWWNAQKWQEMNLGTWGIKMVADDAWQARQPEIDALKAEVERLRADAERLSILDRPGIELRNGYGGKPVSDELRGRFRVTGYREGIEYIVLGVGDTAREAIDAAMKEMK